jgi:hypothetical protein
MVPRLSRERAARHQADEDKDPWHGKHGGAAIDYLLLSDLHDIVTTTKAWPHFEPLFGPAQLVRGGRQRSQRVAPIRVSHEPARER